LPSTASAKNLSKVVTDSDSILLLDTFLDKKPLISALDSYIVNNQLMLAAEPLFDSLTLRYLRETNVLRLWKKQQLVELTLNQTGSDGQWADDGFYLYIDSGTFSKIFNVDITYNISTLKLDIKTQDFQFPKQRLASLAHQRQLEQAATHIDSLEINRDNLLEDQYRLFTIPHGLFSINTNIDHEQETSLNYSVQTVSDFLYHSTSLTINDSNKADATGRLNFSRYKSLPDKLIAGAFDQYSFGDINTISDNLTNNTQSGLGFIFSRSPEQYRNRDVGTTITEVAIPGWDAELYRNGQFIALKKVPNDGNLIFEDVETQYGSNRYEIKLYGPFGEKETRNQYLTLDKNALAQGQMAYSFYGLDADQRLINNQNDDNYSLDNSGASISYGLTDNWLIGFNFTASKDLNQQNQRLYTIKNAFAFPGLLFNNEISLQENRGYAQISSLSGNAFGQDTFNLIYESSDDYQSGRIHSANTKRQYADFSYSGNYRPWNYSLGLGYTDVDNNQSLQIRNILSRSFAGINFSNNLFYNRNKFNNIINKNWNGTFVAAGALTKNVRLSASIDYRPDISKVVQNAALSFGWHDSFNLYHNLRGVYQLQSSDRKWDVNYNLSWNSDKFQLQLAANYDAQSDWTIGLGVRFFLGYDYHNQKMIFSNQLASNSATLNSYSYLDRNPNGWRDEGDWDLQGVKFSGSQAWRNLESGNTGHAILPGVATKVPFKFNAQWEYGTKSLANDFVIYTHPGAYIDVNMPFYVTTDFSGFISKVNYYQEQSPLTGVIIELVNSRNKLVEITASDLDGYYQFSGVIPGTYRISVAQDYLNQSGYTGTNVGFQITTPATGGIIELDGITLQKMPFDQQKGSERISQFSSNPSNTEENIWFEKGNPNNGKVYSLSATGQYGTQQQSFEPDSLPNEPANRVQLPNSPTTREKLPIQPVTRNQLPNQPVQRPTLPIAPSAGPITQPPLDAIVQVNAPPVLNPRQSQVNKQAITRNTLPIQPIVRDRLPFEPVVRDSLPIKPVTRELTETSQEIKRVQVKVVKEIDETVTEKQPNLQVAEDRKNSYDQSSKKEAFTIQLGVYSSRAMAKSMLDKLTNTLLNPYILEIDSKGKRLFKMFSGRFDTRVQAKSFADENIKQSMNYYITSLPKSAKQVPSDDLNLNVQGVVMQFIAGKDKQQIIAQIENLKHLDHLYFAQKQIEGQTWYCLISETFTNKNQAQQALTYTEAPAWLVDRAVFSQVISTAEQL